jgi:hypothetical protein
MNRGSPRLREFRSDHSAHCDLSFVTLWPATARTDSLDFHSRCRPRIRASMPDACNGEVYIRNPSRFAVVRTITLERLPTYHFLAILALEIASFSLLYGAFERT